MAVRYIVRRPFMAMHGKVRYHFVPGEFYNPPADLLKRHKGAFVQVEFFDDQVEQATAGPGEKRTATRKPAAKKPAAKKPAAKK